MGEKQGQLHILSFDTMIKLFPQQMSINVQKSRHDRPIFTLLDDIIRLNHKLNHKRDTQDELHIELIIARKQQRERDVMFQETIVEEEATKGLIIASTMFIKENDMEDDIITWEVVEEELL